MKIDAIFAIIKERLLSVKFNNKNVDEFTSLWQDWSDVEYLRLFFKENQKYLSNGIWGNLTVNEAVEITLNDAEILETYLLEIVESSKTDSEKKLQIIFKPLNDNETCIPLHQKSKLKGRSRNSWLRIYAIRIDENLYVITGGGIKLTHKMEDSEHLKKELLKLELTKNYLYEKGILNKDDYEYLEI